VDALAVANTRLSQAREAFHEALIVERETQLDCFRHPPGSARRKLAQAAHERVRQTAEEYDRAVDAFAKFRVKRDSAVG
jgi:hypothetical protein